MTTPPLDPATVYPWTREVARKGSPYLPTKKDVRDLLRIVDRLAAELAAAQELVQQVRKLHGNSVDPRECMECDHDAQSIYRPCHTAEIIDAALAGEGA